MTGKRNDKETIVQYTMDYDSIIRKHKTTPFVVTSVGLENIILSEVSKKEKIQNDLMCVL